jgi:hypothetical protein
MGPGSLVMGAGALLACSYLLPRPQGLRPDAAKQGDPAASR